MKSNTNLHRLTAFLLTGAVLAAAPVTVNNHSFDTLAPQVFACAGAGCLFDEVAPPGWILTDVGGTFQLNRAYRSSRYTSIAFRTAIGLVTSTPVPWSKPLASLCWKVLRTRSRSKWAFARTASASVQPGSRSFESVGRCSTRLGRLQHQHDRLYGYGGRRRQNDHDRAEPFNRGARGLRQRAAGCQLSRSVAVAVGARCRNQRRCCW